MFILRLISQPKVEKNYSTNIMLVNLRVIYLLNNMVMKFQCDDGIVDYVLDTIYQLKSLKMRCVLD